MTLKTKLTFRRFKRFDWKSNHEFLSFLYFFNRVFFVRSSVFMWANRKQLDILIFYIVFWRIFFSFRFDLLDIILTHFRVTKSIFSNKIDENHWMANHLILLWKMKIECKNNTYCVECTITIDLNQYLHNKINRESLKKNIEHSTVTQSTFSGMCSCLMQEKIIAWINTSTHHPY